MPHIPDVRSHAGHDLELIAAYASGDATGADLDTAAALVAGCAGCSALHHDLRAIAAALPELPVPARRRDFRLTPEQAAALRPAGWRRLLGVLAGPRFSFTAPLGAGLATLGLAVMLLAGPGLPLGLGGAATAERATAGGNAAGPSPAAGAQVPAVAPAPTGASNFGPLDATAAPAGQSAEPGTDIAGGGDDMQVRVSTPTPGTKTVPAADAHNELAAGTDRPIVAGAALIAVVGLLLVGVRLASRRLA